VPALFDDIEALKPTIFPSVPRLFNRLYDKVRTDVFQSLALAWAHRAHIFSTFFLPLLLVPLLGPR